MWCQFETLAGYLKDLRITEVCVNTLGFEPGRFTRKPEQRNSCTASDRIESNETHPPAAAYGVWFRVQVQASIDDRRPSVDDGEARNQVAAKRAALAKRAPSERAAAR